MTGPDFELFMAMHDDCLDEDCCGAAFEEVPFYALQDLQVTEDRDTLFELSVSLLAYYARVSGRSITVA